MLRIGQIEATAQNDKYTDGNVAAGIPATRLRAAAFNAMQEELAGIVEGGGQELDPDDFGQVLKALKLLFAAKTESLGALAALVGAANKLPYFTGTDTAALTSLTAAGRGLIGQADVPGILTYLGLGDLPDFGTAAEKDVGTGAGQIPDMSSFNWGLVPANNGLWFMLPSGIMVQCGRVDGIALDGLATIALTPFPNAGIAAVPAVNLSSAIGGGMVGVYTAGLTKTQLQLRSDGTGSSFPSSFSFYWFAIGY